VVAATSSDGFIVHHCSRSQFPAFILLALRDTELDVIDCSRENAVLLLGKSDFLMTYNHHHGSHAVSWLCCSEMCTVLIFIRVHFAQCVYALDKVGSF